MEQCLRALVSGAGAHDFTLIYSDMHGLWGGTTITLAGAGSYERIEQPWGAATPTITRGELSARQVRAVAMLLVEIAAWEQRAPIMDRMPLPDESWATLEIRCGGSTTRIVERHAELGTNQRLVRVHDRLRELEEHMVPHGGAEAAA